MEGGAGRGGAGHRGGAGTTRKRCEEREGRGRGGRWRRGRRIKSEKREILRMSRARARFSKIRSATSAVFDPPSKSTLQARACISSIDNR